MFAPGQNQLLANLSLLLFFKDLSIVRFYDFKKNFRGMCFTVQLSKIGFALPFVSNSFAIISCRFLPVKNFFQLFLKLFLFLSCSNFDILSHPTGCCQELFSFLFDSFVISVRSLRRNSDRIPPLPGFVNTFFNFSYNFFCGAFSQRVSSSIIPFRFIFVNCFLQFFQTFSTCFFQASRYYITCFLTRLCRIP